ncbi:bis(5'-nucleosyl)-tetraphosphatase (symmetrical) YqeK [Lactococcus garvieae]|jgi:predicted HD superfamily hydrolase involved in NAD metabolism|uniref:bis(5'-nucleosyl)-tetraphosphatase (symmetrical) n=1 Tax=Lactococcus garvieae DCC43 TaxID=1231377 RepID=K2PX35_9LACT|nr:bis(5'-nucleosyl)-tetraphosphatase (symmetrical) YqeK [Lactococcus garvieae]EKF51986.1 HAD superfamily hydrolase YqeK [Lactococcus garvieae DCC43]
MFEFYPEVELSRESLLDKIKEQMSEKRFRHILGVEKAAIFLAKKYGVDPHKASLSALLHDYAKEVPDHVFLELIDKYELDEDLKNWGNNIWHGRVGIYKLQEDLGLRDPEILHAIEVHTVGSADMSALAKVLYVADYIEEGRDFPGVIEARAIANCSLDMAVAFETMRLIDYLAELRVKIYPQSIETYNAFVKYLKN